MNRRPDIRPDILVRNDTLTAPNGDTFRCAIGRGGFVDAARKREGDGATPIGTWLLRRVLFRPDRISVPETGLKIGEISPGDGWCDDPADASYNRPVKRPHPTSHEALWRNDALYDLLAVLGHNDDPPVPGAGSAIFLHVARPGYGPTEGCVALAIDDLRALLRQVSPGSAIRITPPSSPS